MVSLAIPLVEGIGVRLLAALGIGAAAGIAGEAARESAKRRSAEADQARTAPIARTDAQSKTKEKCKECPPDKGAAVTRNWNMSDVSRGYQARITGFAPYTEWNFGGVDFDGFRSSECLLLEAKARYDQFFDPEDGEPKFFFRIIGTRRIMQQAKAHSVVVASNLPSRINWYFMQPLSYRYFVTRFGDEAPIINVLLQP